MNTGEVAAAIRDKKLSVTVRNRLTTSLTVNGDLKSVSHWCGQSVSGPTPIVEEAHRQHLLHCEVAA